MIEVRSYRSGNSLYRWSGRACRFPAFLVQLNFRYKMRIGLPVNEIAKLHCCPHCGVPTEGTDCKDGIHFDMCPDCYAYIGSPAAQLPGATMKNRRAMEALFEANR